MLEKLKSDVPVVGSILRLEEDGEVKGLMLGGFNTSSGSSSSNKSFATLLAISLLNISFSFYSSLSVFLNSSSKYFTVFFSGSWNTDENVRATRDEAVVGALGLTRYLRSDVIVGIKRPSPQSWRCLHIVHV